MQTDILFIGGRLSGHVSIWQGRDHVHDIELVLDDDAASDTLTLTLSTLYSTHRGADGFAIDVAWQPVE